MDRLLEWLAVAVGAIISALAALWLLLPWPTAITPASP